MTANKVNMAGLTSAEAKKLQDKYGKNELTPQKKDNFLKKIFHIICEPMFLLLIVAAIIYFLLGEPRDGAIMLIFVLGIIGIDVIQEWKTDKTLNALKDLSAPHITVIRDGCESEIASSDLVPGDLMMICEGVKIPADGMILRCADLCGADLDFSAMPLWCGDLGAGYDDKQVIQQLYHVLSHAHHSPHVSPRVKQALLTPALVALANEFHRVREGGEIEALKPEAGND